MGALNWNPEITEHNQRIYMKEQEREKNRSKSHLQHKTDNGDTDTNQRSPIFKLVSIKHLIENPVPLKWTIKGILEKGGMNVISGAYGSGKSFIAFDMAFCTAAGIDWHGHKTIQSPVVILCGEGHSGIADRFAALVIKYGIDCPDCLYISEVPAQLTDSVNCEWVASAVNQICPEAGMVIVDTLNRNFGGLDENSTKDMTTFVNNVDAVFRTTGKTVIVVHHAGHNGDRARGSIVLPSACEGEFFIKKQDDGLILTCDKQKNAAKSEPIYFKFKPITLPDRVDDNGEVVGSLCLELTDGAGKAAKRRKISARDDAILTSLGDAIAVNGVEPTAEIKAKFASFDSLVGKLQKIVHIDHWREKAYQTITVNCASEEKKQDALKKAFNRCRDKLFNDGFTVEYGDYVWRVFD